MPSRQSWSKAIGSSPARHELLVQDVEHLQERGVLVDVLDLVLDHAARGRGAGLAPDVEGEIHLLVAPLRRLHVLEVSGSLCSVAETCPTVAVPLPGRDVA